MKQYKVRSGQNIYDIALMLYGSVEGIFDLLASNEWLNMETKLSYGMVLNYHENFAINKSIATWIKDNDILVKNGEHIYDYFNAEDFMKRHIQTEHPDIYSAVLETSPDERNMFWESLFTPRMIIKQQGQTSAITIKLKADKHLVVDWGDYTPPQIIEGIDSQEIEHYYKNPDGHVITFYGDFECELLDLRGINGVFYPLGTIYADTFETALQIEILKKLIITK